MTVLNICYFVFYVVKCPEVPEVDNGNVACSLGDDGVYSYEDTCDVLCNLGYTMTGSDTKRCLSNGSWSGMDTVCERGTNYYQTVCIHKYHRIIYLSLSIVTNYYHT